LIFWSVIAFLGLLFGGWVIWNFSLDPMWQPTDHVTVTRILQLSGLEEGELLYDLGCGDGRIVAAAAKRRGARAVGVEIDPVRFLVSKLRVFFGGVSSRARIKLGNMYEEDLSDADVVVLFLSAKANRKLSSKLREELGPGSRIVSYYHPLPDWEPRQVGRSADNYNLYLYCKPPEEQSNEPRLD